MVKFTLLHPNATEEHLGYLPQFLSEGNPDPAVKQLHENYAHGGGWFPFKGFDMNPKTFYIKYPGDPAYPPIAKATLRDETIVMYPHGWVAVIQKDGTYEIARMD